MTKPEGERRHQRREDRQQLAVQILIIVLIVGMTIGYFVTLHQVKGETNARIQAIEHERSDREHQRLQDQREQCRQASRRLAADVNLNWVYYQSELLLSKPPATKVLDKALATLSPGERAFIVVLTTQSQSGFVLRARAAADREAAYVKAQTIDYRDLKYVHRRTALGSEATPRRWVTEAHYSCDAAFAR